MAKAPKFRTKQATGKRSGTDTPNTRSGEPNEELIQRALREAGVGAAPTGTEDGMWKALNLDPQKYMHLLEGENLTEAQKRECVETVWQIVVNFVDLGFDRHPIQQAMMAPGKSDRTKA